ncbi:MAG: molybdopterin cofactor-binding domain-containing protein, partial [Desulfobacterales bacterium]
MNSENSKAEALGQPSSPVEISRREFLKRLGILSGGILVSLTVGNPLALARTPRVGWGAANIPVDFNAFLRIGTDEKVLCLTGKIEMGQGIITSLPQMLADELGVSYDAVDILMGDTDLCPWDNRTVGSRSTRQFGVFLREAAAEAKGVLKELAAEYLKCPIDRLET